MVFLEMIHQASVKLDLSSEVTLNTGIWGKPAEGFCDWKFLPCCELETLISWVITCSWGVITADTRGLKVHQQLCSKANLVQVKFHTILIPYCVQSGRGLFQKVKIQRGQAYHPAFKITITLLLSNMWSVFLCFNWSTDSTKQNKKYTMTQDKY